MKTVFITGADRGIGFSLCRCFLEAGWKVFAGQFMKDWQELDSLKKEYDTALSLIPLDVGDLNSVTHAATSVRQETDCLDMLVNCAFKVYTINSLQSQNINDILVKIEQEEGHLDLLVLNAPKSYGAEESSSAEDTEELLALLDAQIFGVQSLIEASLPLLKKGEMKRIGMITTPASSIRLCQDTKNFGEHMALSGINMVGKIYFNRLRPEGFSFRWFCDNPEHKGGIKAGEYLLMNFCFDPKEPYIHSDENRLVMRDAHLQEISW